LGTPFLGKNKSIPTYERLDGTIVRKTKPPSMLMLLNYMEALPALIIVPLFYPLIINKKYVKHAP